MIIAKDNSTLTPYISSATPMADSPLTEKIKPINILIE
jgi:hypothetical protein